MSIVTTRDQVQRLPAPAVRSRPSAPAAGMTGRDFLRILRKRWLLIVLVMLLVIGSTVAGTWAWLNFAPTYTARAVLAVSPPPNIVLSNQGVANLPQEIIERYKRSYASLVKQQGVLLNSLNDSEFQNTDYFRSKNADIDRTLIALEEDIEVSSQPETDQIFVSMSRTCYSQTDKDELANIVNIVAKAFVKSSREESTRSYKAERADLQAKRNEEGDLLDRMSKDRNGRLNQNKAGLNSMAALQHDYASLQNGLPKATEERKAAENEAASWENATEEEAANNGKILMEIDHDPQYYNLQMEVNQIKAMLESAILKFGQNHASVKTIQSRLDSAEQMAQDRKMNMTRDLIILMRQRSRGLAKDTKDAEADLLEKLALVRTKMADLDNAISIIESLDKQIKDKQESVKLIDNRLLDLDVTIRRIEGDVGPVSLRAAAFVPKKPSGPSWRIMVPLGVLVALALGVGLAVLLEVGDSSIKGPSDIARRVDLPLLGMVPHSDDMDEEITDLRRAALLAPHSPLAEAFRHIRTNLLYSGPDELRRTLLVTSPSPEDGRTTAVMNLAISMAQAGRRVLVIDANFRQPALAEMFPEASPQGLSSALVGQADWHSVVCKTDIPNLSVIASGPLPPNPADLLGSETMRQLVAQMKAEYDQIIFDGSPITLMADAAVLATQVDGVIMVVRAGSNSAGLVQRASEQLRRVGARVLGVVLQGVRQTAGGYLRKHYETFYEYQQKPLP